MPHRQECTFHLPDGSKVSGVRWQNPDGSAGGWVAETAQVHPTAIVEFNVMVGPNVVIKPGEVVETDRIMG